GGRRHTGPRSDRRPAARQVGRRGPLDSRGPPGRGRLAADRDQPSLGAAGVPGGRGGIGPEVAFDVRTMALDPGSRRIGVAVSDEIGVIATPLAVLERGARRRDLERLRALIEAYRPELLLI